jgi:LCP family protein required for cell wall assembly
MSREKIDLLKQKTYLRLPRRAPVLFFGKILVSAIIVIATIGTVFSYKITTTAESGASSNLSFFSTIKQFVGSDSRELKGEDDDRVNLLIMGIGGEGHDGPQLTDTIIFASYRPSDEAIGLMSLPRDMSVPVPGYGYRKINHANAYGENEKTGNGPKFASEVIGKVLDEEIHYYLRIDFDGFAQFIDAIDGVDVYVEKTFTDSNYPVDGRELAECWGLDPENETDSEEDDEIAETVASDTQTEVVVDYSCRFESVTFNEGWTHMDGATALKFVRSRHGNNGEGSDFARAARQQKIILAVKDKTLSTSTLLNPTRISRMLNTLQNNIATNMNVWEIARFAKKLNGVDISSVTNHVVDASPTSPLYATVLNGAYVLLPKNDDWTPLQNIADQIFTNDSQIGLVFKEAKGTKPKFVRIEIQNGTGITGLALRTSQMLDGQGFDVVKVGNAASREYEHTVIYDLTNGKRADELKILRDFLRADVTLSATGWMISGDIVPKEIVLNVDDYDELATETNVDFLIVLGQNASSLVMQ